MALIEIETEENNIFKSIWSLKDTKIYLSFIKSKQRVPKKGHIINKISTSI